MIAVKHSGHIGDVIYSLPAVKSIAEARGIKVVYYLCYGVPIRTDYDGGVSAPAITRELAEFVKPLLEAQPYIEKCVTIPADSTQDIHFNIDLDMFRLLPVNFRFGHLPLHYMHLTGYFSDYAAPWLCIDGVNCDSRLILLGRSPRNINPTIDFSLLNDIGDVEIKFVGTDGEFAAMKKYVPKLDHAKAADAHQVLRLIASCRLFIGNSSFNFAVAEGLKKQRLFEMNTQVQSLMPCGNVGYFTSTEELAHQISRALGRS